jgi:DNA replication factor GINS
VDSILNRIQVYLSVELKSDQVEKVPPTIYREVADYIKDVRNLADENSRNLTSNLLKRERLLLAGMTMRLLEVRLGKTSAHVDDASNGMNLTPEEKYLVEPSTMSRKRLAKISRAVVSGQTAVLGNISTLISSRYVVVRFLQPASATIGVDLAKYGPFKKEDVAVLPLDNAKPLLKQGIVQEIDLEE